LTIFYLGYISPSRLKKLHLYNIMQKNKQHLDNDYENLDMPEDEEGQFPEEDEN
jgi:hypothetical protein